ncbi:MAG: glycerate kinase [Candidatus Melainabacteria bacterium]|nr:MAG: glycerate kinase [Candidatus Melainabacteria bacterium]
MYIQKFLLLPNAYKGAFCASKVASFMERGIRQVTPNASCVLLPVADGGDGTLSIISSVLKGTLHTLNVPGPLGQIIEASWFLTDQNIAVIELAQASGISHVQKLDALSANTLGTGILIKDAFDKGIRNFILTVGGSASTDGGTGILCALGAKLLDKNEAQLSPCGANLETIEKIDLSLINADLYNCRFTIACDVDNPLFGPNGAAYIFAPQKGASYEQVQLLDRGLAHLGQLLNPDLVNFKGAGAAGGVPYALSCVFGAEIVSGFKWIMDIFDLESKIKEADIVLTGEGALDEQSIHGKAVGQILDLCIKHNKKLWIFPAVKNMQGYDFIPEASVFAIQKDPNQFVELSDIQNEVAQACLSNLDKLT